MTSESLPEDGFLYADQILSPFDRYSAPEFERWLREGFEGYFFAGEGVWAFPMAEGLLSGPEALVKRLGAFYRSLKPMAQGSFRQAIADLLALLPEEARYFPVFVDLLALAVDVRAQEILRVLPSRVGNGYFGGRFAEGQINLFTQILLSVAQLSAPREDALRCLLALVSSRHFDSAYAGLALQALCIAKPEALVDHMQRLRDLLAAQFQEFDPSFENRKELVRSVLETVGLSGVVAALPDLQFADLLQSDTCQGPNDDWFFEGLLFGEASVLECQMPKFGKFVFSVRENQMLVREILYCYDVGFVNFIVKYIDPKPHDLMFEIDPDQWYKTDHSLEKVSPGNVSIITDLDFFEGISGLDVIEEPSSLNVYEEFWKRRANLYHLGRSQSAEKVEYKVLCDNIENISKSKFGVFIYRDRELRFINVDSKQMWASVIVSARLIKQAREIQKISNLISSIAVMSNQPVAETMTEVQMCLPDFHGGEDGNGRPNWLSQDPDQPAIHMRFRVTGTLLFR
ncbi:MAG: hypothetical protein HQM06_06575 [Magnetococcales bacterium]|nr:hypothetical protein [Magnetococcales bacterium]